MSSLLFNTVLQFSLDNDQKRWQEKQKNIKLSDKTEDCLTNLRFADDVFLFSTSLERLREMLCEFKASTEAVGLGIHPDKTKILSNQDKVKAKEITVNNFKIEVLAKGDSARYLGQKITFEEQEIEEIKKQADSSVGSVPQIPSRAYLERLPIVPQTSPLRNGHHAYIDLRQWNMGINTKTWKDDQDCATKDASPYRTDKRKYKSKKDVAKNMEEEIKNQADQESKGATDKETEKGSDHNSNTDQDSDVSFQEDAEEEIDSTENEEYWIEYIKRSTKEAEEHMEKQKIPCWIETHRRLNWRMARRIVSLPDKRWTRRILDWHPGLDNSIKTRRQVGRPKRRWKDDLNEFLKPDETKQKTKYDLMNNNSWMMEAKNYEEWKKKKRL